MTDDEKNIRWALNKFFYTQNKNSLNTAYTLMLKDKYCNAEGVLLPQYPSFYQFRYYYRNHKKTQNYYISRNGIKNYQRNNRPLLGDGIQEFAPAVGVGMLDATVCDIYLVNEAGGIVGRPILTACVDAYSGLCCGYSLSWEGGVYSLRNLMTNVIADKTELCRKHGISINPQQWNCNMLPATLATDMGKEYVSNTFEQIADLGVTIVNLQPYRPELKGAVEKFFDIVQGLYKPHLKGKGVIEPDYQERGAHDYRKDASLTMADFEKIILRCIVYYNSQRIVENFPYTEKKLADGVKPYASDIWNYGLNQAGANLIPADYNTLVLTLLPRTTGKFSRKGLLLEILRKVDEVIGSDYYKNALKIRVTTDMLIGSVSQVAINHIGLLVVNEIQNVVNSKHGKSLVGMLTQLINNSGISICMVGTPESSVFFEQAMQLARRSLGLHYQSLECDRYFYDFCCTLFSFQYTKHKAEITDAIINWLYEHSGGIVSIVVSLIHDAQEIAILNGKEILSIETLNEAYKKRLSMLHSYIEPTITHRKQTATKKKAKPEPPQVQSDITDDFSITELAATAKANNSDIVNLLKAHISIEEVRV